MFCHFSTSRASPPTRGPRHRDAYAWSAQSAVSDPIPVELYHSSMGRRAPSLYCRDPYWSYILMYGCTVALLCVSVLKAPWSRSLARLA